MNNLEIGNRITKIREVFNITQVEFGERLGMTSKDSISRIERGVTPLTSKNIKAICAIYSVREEWLCEGKGEMFLPGMDNIAIHQLFSRLSPEMKEFADFLLNSLVDFQEQKKNKKED